MGDGMVRTWYLVRRVLHTPVSNIIPTRNGITALEAILDRSPWGCTAGSSAVCCERYGRRELWLLYVLGVLASSAGVVAREWSCDVSRPFLIGRKRDMAETRQPWKQQQRA